MEQIEKDILHMKAGALLQLGMQIGAELQLTKENDRDQVMMQLLAMQRLVQMEGYSLDFALTHSEGSWYRWAKDIFDFPENQRESYRQKLANAKEASKPKTSKKCQKGCDFNII